MSAPSLKPMSVEEYLRTEESNPYKREYVGGYVYPLYGTRAQAPAEDMSVSPSISFRRSMPWPCR